MRSHAVPENTRFPTARWLLTITLSAAAAYGFMFAALIAGAHRPNLVLFTPSVIGFVGVVIYGDVRNTAFSRYLLNGLKGLLLWYLIVFITFRFVGHHPELFFLLSYPFIATLTFAFAMAGMIAGGIMGWLLRQALERDEEYPAE